MGFRFVCPADGQAFNEALEATREFAVILRKLPLQPTEALHAVAAHGSPLVLAEAVALGAALACWVFYLISRNCSHVDRMWSILPPVYVAIFARTDIAAALAAARAAIASSSAGPGGLPALLTAVRISVADSDADPRLLLATLLAALWGCRLTFNFWRRGGYNLRFEDYRWPVVRTLMHPVLFEVFNLVFVALAQHLLCLLITTPAFVAATMGRAAAAAGAAPPRLGAADWAAAGAILLLVVGETVSDQQQWAFQRRKLEMIARRQTRTGDYKRGFRTNGLFRFSRHPNFFCEYGIWWAFYVLCAVLPCHCVLGWSAAGAVGVTVLLHAGSLWITERISAAKYPAYAAYQATTSAIVPWWPGRPLHDE